MGRARFILMLFVFFIYHRSALYRNLSYSPVLHAFLPKYHVCTGKLSLISLWLYPSSAPCNPYPLLYRQVLSTPSLSPCSPLPYISCAFYSPPICIMYLSSLNTVYNVPRSLLYLTCYHLSYPQVYFVDLLALTTLPPSYISVCTSKVCRLHLRLNVIRLI